jgi:putative oxidoreductase
MNPSRPSLAARPPERPDEANGFSDQICRSLFFPILYGYCAMLFLEWLAVGAFFREPVRPSQTIVRMEAAVQRNLPMILIRVSVGLVFLIEGTLKFLRPGVLGEGRFAAIGLPYPHQLAPLVGGVEIAGGAAVLLNFYAGDAALALLAVIITALITTKVPILLGRPLGPFALAKADEYGWLASSTKRAPICACSSACWRFSSTPASKRGAEGTGTRAENELGLRGLPNAWRSIVRKLTMQSPGTHQ